MNKIFKVIYSKTRHCYVVVSELAKSHCKTTQSHTVRSKTALTAAVLLALGAFSFVGMPVVQAADGTESLRNNDFVGANDQYWYYDEKKGEWTTYQYKLTSAFNNRARGKLPNYQGGGAKFPGAVTAGLYAQAGQQTVTIGDRNAGQSKGSVFIGEHSGYNNGDNAPAGMKNNYVTSVGFQSDATGWGSIAIGSNATTENSKMESQVVEEVGNANTSGTVSDDTYGIKENPTIQGASVALGYNAHSKDGNIAIGAYSDATTDLSADTSDKAKSYLTKNNATSYVSVGSKDVQRRISNVADGAADSDAATIAQLKEAVKATDASKKANIDASNIGKNLKFKADGKTAADSSDITTNENDWGTAIGTGKVEDKNGQLVTGGTVYNALQQQADNLKVNAGWGINVADENDPTNTGKKTKNVISLKHNLGTGYNDDEAKGMIIGGLVEDRDTAKQYGAADANSVIVGAGKALASGKSSVVVGGLDNVASGATSVVVGGDNNNAAGNQSAVFGGRDNTAGGIASTAGGGIMNVANGQQAVALGGAYNYALGVSSTAIGGTGGNGMYGYSTSVNGNYSVSLAGGSTGTDALNGLAAGNQSVVTTANGTAVGYQATTDQEGTIAFGHDAGDVSGYAVTWKQRTDDKKNADHTTNDYTQVPDSVTPTTYKDAYYNRLVKVADGQDDHDVVVMEQLKNAKNDLKVNAGWGINVNDVTTKNDDGTETTTKNVISLNRNLGTNNGNTEANYNGKVYNGKVSFEAKGKNSLILGGEASTTLDTNVTAGTDGDYSVLVGGYNNSVKSAGKRVVVAAGSYNKASGENSAVIGGSYNQASGDHSVVIGGGESSDDQGNQASGQFSTIIGGDGNKAKGINDVVSGGYQNITSGGSSFIGGGQSNKALGFATAILGGAYNMGVDDTTVVGGQLNLAVSYGAFVAGGSANQVAGFMSAAIGGEKQRVIGNYSTAIGGASTGIDAEHATAIGSHAVVTSKNGLALGYKATADKEGTISFGHDKGDVSGYESKIEYGPYGYYSGEVTSYFVTPASGEDARSVVYTPTYYESAEYNRLVKVADGIDAHDAVVMEQLKPYTKSDASNVGANLKTYTVGDNGETITEAVATADQKKDNKDAWGKALGAEKFSEGTTTTATNASTSDQLVTGKTLYNYDNPTGSANYVNVNNTTGQNLSALDAQVKANADTLNDKTHNIKYYSISDNAPTLGFDSYSNAGNDGAKGNGSLAAGFVTHADGIASTVVGSYSGVMNKGTALGPLGLDYRGATAVSLGTVNVNNNTDTSKPYSGVANSIVGQANMTTNSNAAIIYGAGNTVTDSYRPINDKKAAGILGSISDPTKLSEAMQNAVKDSGGQVMVMGGGNNVESAYMSQVVGVGNTVKGNQVENTKGEWGTDTSDTAIKDYNSEKSSQYNYVDGFNNEVINGKHDYVIGANNKLSGDSYDDDQANPIKRSNKSNIVIGDNHTLTRKQNTVIIGSSDTENTQTIARDAVIIGHNANATSDTGADNAVAIGRAATATGGNAVTIGVNTSTGENSITIGSESHANSGSNIAIGRSAQVYGYEVTNAVALGQEANAQVADGVAIGSGSEATVAGKTTEGYDPATGQNSTETTATWQATKAAVSIGKADGTVTRQINGVAAGTNDTDAVNVAQLKSLQSGLTNDLTDKGLKFAANSGAEYTAKLGSTVKIQGTEKKEGHEYTADNLTTEIDENGNITILMDKDMSVEKLAVNGKNGKDGAPGSIGISGQDGKAGVGIDGKNGISIKGQNGKDGVTIKGIDGVDGVDGAEGHIGLNGKDGMTDIFTTAGKPGLDGKDGETMTRIVYKDPKGTEHDVATLDDGLKFKGDDTTVINKKLNNTLDIIGGAKGDLTEGNIGINSTKEGKLKVQLAKDLTGITSISNQKTEGGKTTGAKITLGDNGSVDVNGGKITHVGSGIEKDATGNITEASKTNAANIGDVQTIAESTATSLTDTGLKFAANSGAEYTAKLGSKVTIQSTAKKEGHEYTADNLTTEIDENGNIKILMDKDMSVEKLAVNGKNGKDGAPGSIGINGQDSKSGIGIDGKDGISIKGRDGKDGVTMKAVDGENGTEGHIGLTGPAGTNGIKGADGQPETSIDITVKNGYDGKAGTDGKDGVKGEKGVDCTSLTRIVYKDGAGEHQVATMGDGLKFKGDDGTEIAKKLNNTMEIIGGADSTKLTDKNIGVNSDGDKLKVQLSKDLTGMNSTTYTTTTGEGESATTSTTVVNGNGLMITDGPSITNKGIDSGNKVITNVGSGIETDANGKYTVTDQNKGNAANIGDVQNMVNEAVNSAADTTNKALAGKANIDASNIGANLKNADGSVASAEDQKTNAEKWGSAIGTGEIKADDGRMVTGKTVYDEVRPKVDGSYVKKDKTTGENLSALDSKIGSLDQDGNYIKKDDSVSKNLSTLDTQVKNNAESIQNITNNVKNLSNNAVQYDEGSNKTKVTLGGEGGTTITNVKDGALNDSSTDAVNGKQLYKEVHVDSDGSYIKSNNTVGQNLSALDSGLKTTSDLIHTNTKGDTIQIGGSSSASKIDVNGKDGKGRVITGVISDANDPNSAANVGYVNGLTAANTQQIYRDMNNAYSRLDTNINRAVAGSNALAALHPLDFDPADKASFAVGYGHYRNANAAAVGAFYQPNANTMVNMGISLGNGDPGFNAGVSFKIGKGSAYNGVSKAEMAQTIHDQATEISAIKADDAAKDKRIDALEKENQEMKKQIQEILARLNG